MGTLSSPRNQCVLASELMLMIEILYEAQIFPRDFSLMDLIEPQSVLYCDGHVCWKMLMHILKVTFFCLSLLFSISLLIIHCHCRVPQDLNCLRIVECISGVNTRSKGLRRAVAFQILINCFDNKVTDILFHFCMWLYA